VGGVTFTGLKETGASSGELAVVRLSQEASAPAGVRVAREEAVVGPDGAHAGQPEQQTNQREMET
jgi:hypothetical protein